MDKFWLFLCRRKENKDKVRNTWEVAIINWRNRPAFSTQSSCWSSFSESKTTRSIHHPLHCWEIEDYWFKTNPKRNCLPLTHTAALLTDEDSPVARQLKIERVAVQYHKNIVAHLPCNHKNLSFAAVGDILKEIDSP